MPILSKINEISVWISEKLLTIFLGVNCIIIFWSALYRYIFRIGQQWIEEVALSLMVWSVFLGCNIAIRKNIHTKVEIFIAKIPVNYKRCVMVLVYLGMLLFIFIVFRHGLDLVYILRISRSPALRFRMYWVTSSIPIGFGLSFLQVAELLLLELRGIYSELPISRRSKI